MWRRRRRMKLLFLLLCFCIASSAAAENGCNCEYYDGFWSVENILEWQKVSDFLIAVAYFSIPIELIYFITCSNVPFKLVLFEFIAFIVLCGMTHLLNGWTYYGQHHSFHLMLALTVFKVLTAMVSFATAITLISLIPMLLKVKVREFMLKKKAWDLGREVGIIKRQSEAGRHVRMLTREIRKSLDRHTILYTTLIELSKTLDLHSCAIWMPDEDRTEMNLTHEVRDRKFSDVNTLTIPIHDPDVQEIKCSDDVKLLEPESALAAASGGEPGCVAAIRMPMLQVANFKGGTPELFPGCYAILVLVLPPGTGRSWGTQEIEIVKVVANQVTVAISHAAVLEESKNMREKLAEQNRALQQAREGALRAHQARNAFQAVMSNGMRRPMHSILGLLSLLQEEEGEALKPDQRLLVNAMVKTGNVITNLINDVMDGREKRRFPLETRSFELHSMIKEAACLAKCICAYKRFDFSVDIDRSLPNHVMGDERRAFQVILHMVGNLLKNSRSTASNRGGGCLKFRVGPERSNPSSENVYVRIEIGIHGTNQCQPGGAVMHHNALTSNLPMYCGKNFEEGLSFRVCKKLVQMMQGDIWVYPNPVGFDQLMAVVLGFQHRPSIAVGGDSSSSSSNHCRQPHSNTHLLRGLNVLLADYDDVNRSVTRRLLEKLGCAVSAVSSGHASLGSLSPAASAFQVVLLDLHLPDLDGFEVAMRIRKFRSRNWPIIVALTASDDDDVIGRCFQAGFNGVICKPVVLHDIADQLTQVLLKARGHIRESDNLGVW